MACTTFSKTALRSLLLSLVLMLVMCACAQAAPSEDKEADKAAAQANTAALQAQAEELMDRIDACQDQIKEANKAIKQAEAEYDKSVEASENAKKQIKEQEKHIKELQGKLETLSVELYKGHRSDNPLLGLLDAESYIEFDNALDAIEDIADEESDLLDEAQEARDKMEEAQREYDAFAQKALAEKEEAIKARDDAKGLYDELSAEVAQITSQISDENARHLIASAVAEKIFPGDANLKNPCPTATKSDGFGYRDFDNSFHQGLDLAAAEGTPYYAAASGTVISATNDGSDNGGAGNWVVIAHGNGVVTKYMHSKRTLVKVGDIVLQGQHIGDVGNTGASFGAHLHFQVEIDGTAVDPEKLIKGEVLV